MPRMYQHSFIVASNLVFPTDMLRYDSCYPTKEDEAHDMTRSARGEDAPAFSPKDHASWVYNGGAPSVKSGFVFHLMHVASSKTWKPTVARWRSFGYIVFEDQHTVEARTV